MNCQGLGDAKKRRDVLNYLRKYGRVVIQDTHFSQKMHNRIKQEWGYEVLFSSFSSQSRGVAVFFKNTFELKIHSTKTDNSGNLLVIDLTINDFRLTLAGIYAPNKDDPQFFKDLKQE